MHKGNASICIGGIVITALVYIHILSLQMLSNRTVKKKWRNHTQNRQKPIPQTMLRANFGVSIFELIAVKINKFGSNTNCALGIEINLKSPTLANFRPFFLHFLYILVIIFSRHEWSCLEVYLFTSEDDCKAHW